jgi:hypothetical protein
MMTLKYSIVSLSALMLLASCSSDDLTNENASDRLALSFDASLSSAQVTRATANSFDTGETLYTFVQHVDADNQLVSIDDRSPRMVTLTVGSDKTSVTSTEDLYWDDFSLGGGDDDTNLRKSGHGLRSYYGYGYNGGTPSTELVNSTGVLGWTAPTTQNSAEIVQHADLLWSSTQPKVAYNRGSSSAVSGTGTLSVPYTHAMSEFTIELVAGDGFTSNTTFANTTVTLHQMNTVGTFTAPSATVSGGTEADITMYKSSMTADRRSTFVAMTVPGTDLAEGDSLITITDADGNNYHLNVTQAMLSTGESNWGSGLATVTSESATTYATQPGYNYHLTVTLAKQGITVEASLADWQTVTATGDGVINFSADVTTQNATEGLTSGDTFDLWMVQDATDYTYGEKSSLVSYDGTGLSLAPSLYWPNGKDKFFFRAQANRSVEGALSGNISEPTTVSQGEDRMWATTKAADGYDEGDSLSPRTGNVPLLFSHIMSKISVVLKTPVAASGAADANTKHVNLEGATISISNVYPSGTVNIHNGSITPSGTKAAITTTEGIAADAVKTEESYNTAAALTDYIVVPQSTSAMVLTITLGDGTVYKINLNSDAITLAGSTDLDEWVRGKAYVYTITLEKEAVTVAGLVKNWEEVTGSGKAILEWD